MSEIFATIEVQNKECEAEEKLLSPQVFEETGEVTGSIVTSN